MKPRTIPTSPKQKELEDIDKVFAADQPIVRPGPRYGMVITVSTVLSVILWFGLFVGLRFAAQHWPSVRYLEFFRTPVSTTTERVVIDNAAVPEEKSVLGAILKQVTPSLMSLVKHTNDDILYQGQPVGQAIALTSDGVALTTSVVGSDFTQYSAYTVSGVRLTASASAADPFSGLTLIKVPSPTNAISFGSLTEMGIGARVFIVNHSPTHGGVRSIESEIVTLRDNIQAYAAGVTGAPPESSEKSDRRFSLAGSLDDSWIGSAVLDEQSRLIGLVTSTDTLVRATSIGSVRDRIDAFSGTTQLVRPRLGVMYVDLAFATAGASLPSKGALITTLVDGKGAAGKSPARIAGVRTNDVVTAVNTKPLSEYYSLSDAIVEKTVGEKVVLTILRNDAQLDVSVTLTQNSEK